MVLVTCCFQLSLSSNVMPSIRVDCTIWRGCEPTDSWGGVTAGEEVQKCITMVLMWLMDTLFTSVHVYRLSRVACRGEKSGDLVLTAMPTVPSSTYFQRCGVLVRASVIRMRKHSGPILVSCGTPQVRC